ncbi:MAG: hypothetical protein O2856_13720, partial [Planctomycetota bacterium]|nr:hypothetical protein [Planctomycetota bacterium]
MIHTELLSVEQSPVDIRRDHVVLHLSAIVQFYRRFWSVKATAADVDKYFARHQHRPPNVYKRAKP